MAKLRYMLSPFLLFRSLREKYPYWEFSWSVYRAFGLNTERHFVPLRIQFEYGKIRTRKTPNTDTFYAARIFLLIVIS